MARLNPTDEDVFVIYNIDSPDDWGAIYEELKFGIQRYAERFRFDMIPMYFGDKCKSVLIEKQYNDKDYRDSYYNFFSKKFTRYPKNCMRLHFFSEKFASDRDLWNLETIEKEKKMYLGNIIFRPLSPGCIGRTTINASRTIVPSFLACQAKYEINILGSRLIVEAFPFTSQDTDVSQCVLAALWMTLRYYSQKYPNYKEIYPHEISQLSKDFSWGRTTPTHKGLTIHQLTEDLAYYGFSPVLYLKNSYPLNEGLFYRVLYYYVESGIPLIIGLPRHAVATFGHLKGMKHTPCTAHATCKAVGTRFLNSCCFNQGYIINDDNFMPYRALLKQGSSLPPADMKYASQFRVEDIQSFVVPLYEKIYLPAEKVDDLAKSIISHRQLGIDALSKLKFPVDQKFVIRIFLTSSRSYKYYRRTALIPGHADRYYVGNPMPKFIWVAEISTQDLYMNGKILGEIIFDATANQNDRNAFMYIHYPGKLVMNDRDHIGDFPDRYGDPLDLGIDRNYEYDVYMSNLLEGGRP